MRRSRVVPVLVVLALGAGACNGSTSADVAPNPSPPAAAASPSPSPSPAPSPSPTEVLPANDVDDPVAALEAIVAYRDWLFENPDPDKLQLIYAGRCDCYEEVAPLLRDASSEGTRLDFDRSRAIEIIEVVKRQGPLAQIRYLSDSPGADELSADGVVKASVAGSDEMEESEVILVREGGRWLVIAFV